MVSKDRKAPMGFTGETFPPGIHMCYIYNDDDERKRIIFQFLKSGLHNGEKVSYFIDMNNTDEMKEYQSVLGVDKLYEEQRGHFCLATTRETYFPDGIFIPDEMLDRLGEFYSRSISEGYTGARATGEMSWAVGDIPGSSRLMEYEARVNNDLMKYPVTTLCQYNVRLFDGKLLRDTLIVHPTLIFHGRILKNPYYIKSWWLMKKYLGLNEEDGNIPIDKSGAQQLG
jgi:hypothetical protein